MRTRLMMASAMVGSACVALFAAHAAPAGPRVSFGAPVLLAGSAGQSEPRIAVAPSGALLAMANASDGGGYGTARMWVSHDGGRHFAASQSDLPLQSQPTIDLDLTSTASGRVVASELDARPQLPAVTAGYTDDLGGTWHPSVGIPVDIDRQWLASGPGETVYLIWHDFYSGLIAHDVFIQTSTDGGQTFGAPVPIFTPGGRAQTDLSCGDSTGPSGIAVDRRSGRIFVSVATQTSPVGGGCGRLANLDPGFNVVPSTRIWVASSPDGSPGSWKESLAVDQSASGRFVGLQYAPVATDLSGRVYLAYTQAKARGSYVSDVRYVSSADGSTWSQPTAVPGSTGSLFAHVVAGASGRVALAYLQSSDPVSNGEWHPMVAATIDGLAARPHFAVAQLSAFRAFNGTPAAMSAACGAAGPASGLQQGLLCNRYLDNFGMTADKRGLVSVIWPAQFASTDDAKSGIYVATQTGGIRLR